MKVPSPTRAPHSLTNISTLFSFSCFSFLNEGNKTKKETCSKTVPSVETDTPQMAIWNISLPIFEALASKRGTMHVTWNHAISGAKGSLASSTCATNLHYCFFSSTQVSDQPHMYKHTSYITIHAEGTH